MASKQVIEQFKQEHKFWSEFDFESAVRNDMGAHAFVELKPIVASVSDMLGSTDTVKEELSTDVVHNMYQYAQQIRSVCLSLQKSDPSDVIKKKPSAIAEIERLLDNMRQVWPSVLSLVMARGNFVGTQRGEIDRLQKRNQRAEDLLHELQEKSATFTKATEGIASSSVIKEELVFSEAANRFRKVGWVWLSGIVVFSIVFVVILCLLLKSFCFELNCYQKVGELNYNDICTDCNRQVLYLEMAKAVTFRILVISFMLFLIGVCVKNYYAAMHNYTVNTHKANSLAAARTMLGLNLSAKGRSQLMTMAASAIFSHQSTGYNSKRPENATLGQVLGTIAGRSGAGTEK